MTAKQQLKLLEDLKIRKNKSIAAKRYWKSVDIKEEMNRRKNIHAD